MLDVPARALSDILIQNQIIPEDDREIYDFGFECRLADVTQFIILAAFALPLGLVAETTCFTVCFTAIKRHIGGWHADSHGACLISTTIMTAASVLACAYIGDNRSTSVTVGFILTAALIIIRFAPVLHLNNPKSEQEKRKHRSLSLLVLSLQATAILAAMAAPIRGVLPLCCACGLFTAAFTLIIPNKRGGTQE